MGVEVDWYGFTAMPYATVLSEMDITGMPPPLSGGRAGRDGWVSGSTWARPRHHPSARGYLMPAGRNAAKPHSRAHRRPVSQAQRAALVDLPAGGCTYPVPPLPAGRDWSTDEQARWVELWESPQATQWDDSARGTVALLVAYESLVFSGSASAWHAQEARYAAEALGLTPRSLAALGWRIVE